MRLRLYLIFILIAVLFSCKKETDTELPSITINKPASNSSYDVLDTIWIKAKITDNEIIKSVSYGVTDDKAEYVTNTKTKTYNSNSVDFSGYIILDDVRIESGNYTITITAFDGENTRKTFRNIYIKALTKKLENIFIITEMASTSKVYELTNDGFDLKYTLNDNITDAKINSYLKTFYLLDKSGNLNALSISNFETYWQDNNLNNNLVDYKGKLLIYDDYCFASVKNNNIQAYDVNGNIRKTAVSSLYAYEPSVFTIQNDYFVNYTYNNTIADNYIEKLYYTSGASQTYYNINFDAVDLLNLNSNEIIVFGNKQDTMRIAKLKLDATQLQYIDIEFTEKLKSVVKISDDEFLFSTQSGLYLLDESMNSYYSVRNDISSEYLFKEELSGQIYSLNNNEIEILNPPYYNTVNIVTLPENCVKVLFNYNK